MERRCPESRSKTPLPLRDISRRGGGSASASGGFGDVGENIPERRVGERFNGPQYGVCVTPMPRWTPNPVKGHLLQLVLLFFWVGVFVFLAVLFPHRFWWVFIPWVVVTYIGLVGVLEHRRKARRQREQSESAELN